MKVRRTVLPNALAESVQNRIGKGCIFSGRGSESQIHEPHLTKSLPLLPD